jgi:hypothetical protein
VSRKHQAAAATTKGGYQVCLCRLPGKTHDLYIEAEIIQPVRQQLDDSQVALVQ